MKQTFLAAKQTLIAIEKKQKNKVWSEKNETRVLSCSSETIAAGALRQAKRKLYML